MSDQPGLNAITPYFGADTWEAICGEELQRGPTPDLLRRMAHDLAVAAAHMEMPSPTVTGTFERHLIRATIASRESHRTCWLELHVPPNAKGDQLYNALNTAGWRHHWKLALAPALDGTTTQVWKKEGAGPFESWTDAERTSALQALVNLLAAAGVVYIRHCYRPDEGL